VLVARANDGSIATHGKGTRPDNDAIRRFMRLAKDADGTISLERSTLGELERWEGTPTAGRALAAAELDRTLDWDWRRTSYSDITAASHESRVASEPEEPVLDDEPEEPVPAAEEATGELAEVPSLLADGPGGTRFGTFVHTVFETVDFAADDLQAELSERVAEAVARKPVELGDRARVIAGLQAAIETPLGPLAGGVRLRDVHRADRLDELTFELPLVGGDTPTGTVTPSAIGDVLRRHLPPGDPLAGYADRLSDPDLRAAVRGYLTGSIDLALRLHGAFYVIDYKTNWLASPGEPLTAWHYRPAALTEEMERSHYGLQALLYTVALHRYLRWRLAGYDPAQRLGGVLYLFIRGMTGPNTPVVDGQPCGVFSWKAPPALVVELDQVIEGTAGAEPAPAQLQLGAGA
jgi:exodeoxyribonuclease V beta subunit